MIRGPERRAPLREEARQLARVLVVARPLERLARAGQLRLVRGVRVARAARPQRPQRPFGALAAVDPRRSEEDDRVLDPLLLEPSERLEVLGENADRARFLAFEKIRVEVRQRRLRHDGQFITRC